MPEYIQKKCPECGAILTIKQQPGVQGMTVKCPVCQESYPFSRMTDVTEAGGGAAQQSAARNQEQGTRYPGAPGGQQPTGDGTQYPGYGSGDPGTNYSGGTSYGNTAGGINRTVGSLVMPNGFRFKLRPGNNVIGRASTTNTQATIQIQTPGSLRLSRSHLLVIVGHDPSGNIIHKCQLCKAQCNDTFINGSKLQYGDVVILRPGMQLQLPDVTLRFELGDGADATQFGVPPVPPVPPRRF